MSRRRRSRWWAPPSLCTFFVGAALLLLGAGHYLALWDHASRLPHPSASSLETFFPDLAATAAWLHEQPIREVVVPSRHLRPQLWHRLCEMAYPIRCRPFPERLPRPGQWLVVPAGEPLAAESVVLRRQGRLEIRRLIGAWDPDLYRELLPRSRRALRARPGVETGGAP